KGSFGLTDSYKSCVLQLRLEILKIMQKAKEEGLDLISQEVYDFTNPLNKELLVNIFAKKLTFGFSLSDDTMRSLEDLENHAKQVVPLSVTVRRDYSIHS